MTAVATASPGLDHSDMDPSRVGMYSPAASTHSQYSTYSREVKYIFNPLQERNENVVDEYADYSHIVAKDKATTGHYLAYTPHSATNTPLGSCHNNSNCGGPNTPLGGSGPLSLTPCNMSGISQNSNPNSRRESGIISPRDDVINHNQSNHPSRTNSVISNQSRDNRGPMSPFANEAIYSSTNHNARLSQQRLSAHLEQQMSHRDANGNRCPTSPTSNISPYAPKHPYLSPRNSTSSRASGQSVITPNSGPPSYSQITIQGSAYNLNTNHSQQQTHQMNNHHHQPLHEQPHNLPPSNHHPPYPQPPSYYKRKTWSPPILKLASQHGRVSHSNDSLIDHYLSDTAAMTSGVKASQRSRSDDLDSTPPRLAPISGVLAWKPGPNVVRPIAFKPISNNMSPHTSRHPSGDDHVTVSHDLARPQAVKLGTGMLGHRISPEKSAGGRRGQHPISTGNKSAMHAQETNNLSQHTPVPLGGFRQITINTNSSSAPHHNIPVNSHNLHNNMNNANSAHNLSSSSSSHHNISSYSQLNNSHSQSSHPQHLNNSASISFNNSHNASAASSNSHHNTSATSSRLSCAEDSFMGEFAPRPSDRADSVPVATNNNSITSSRGWHHGGDGVLQTPSPSDSGVGELEAILREKDAEINTLRETMDRNERAILQVYEERKNAWALDTQDLREEYERKLKIQSRKSYKTEQVLSLQVYKLQQEQKSLTEEKDQAIGERDGLKSQLEEANSEILKLRSELELKSKISDALDSPDSNEELAIKNKEVINLHTQLHSYQVDMEKKNKELGEKAKEVISCKEEVEKLRRELDRVHNPPVTCEVSSQTHNASCEVANLENVKPSMMGERERTIQTLQEELNELRTQVLGMDDRHEKEKEQWLDEKNKVIRYQKQLQLNYVQMQRKNSTLETEVQQLTLELENRDMKLIALSGEESVC